METYLNRVQVHHVLNQFGCLSMFPTEEEIKVIKSISDALEIVEAGTTDLCSLKETLASADQGGHSIIIFLLDKSL